MPVLHRTLQSVPHIGRRSLSWSLVPPNHLLPRYSMFSVFHATATRSVVAACPLCCYVLPLVTTRFVSTPTTRDCAGALVFVAVVVVAVVENAALASEGK
ncbi:uncharacterized protein LY79DRAFT_540475 [Colletotrichum navitas]|uniref:Uncharacterized protein n=1 Tax=Colletotrichum navitas TaxID=681940 RepID=A0AAD8Q892_9PEZI|nr:uncharacterized protein LY79DRAFT_540475 [Colletotrichum navitas]KAK1597610.1 hypothetical protein LY79DRAFT_540475 [Colletotrichum navitas]